MGNNGSGCLFLRRGSRKKVVVVCTVCVVVVVLPYTLSPELASDLEDSDNLFGGSANAEAWSSPYGGGARACEEDVGRLGSSNDTLCSGPRRIGSCPADPPFAPSTPSALGSSPDRRNRAVKFIREDFFFGPIELKVGAVVMISGAVASVCQHSRVNPVPGGRTVQDERGRYIRRGTGGGFCAAAWSFAFAAS